MHMIGFTIATGKYLPYGLQAAETMQAHTGILCQVCRDVPDGRHPSYHRLWIWDLVPDDVEAVLYFDADTYCVRDWDPRALAATGDFWARRDVPTRKAPRECRRYGIAPAMYFNAGVFVASRAHREAFVLAQQIATAEDYQSAFLEQTALNVAVQRSGVSWADLPPRYNWICRPRCGVPAEDVAVLHSCGGNLSGRNLSLFKLLIQQCVSQS